jgi:hypothetical protein
MTARNPGRPYPGEVEAALIAYEQDLFPRSSSAAAEADRNLKLFFDEASPQSLTVDSRAV